MTATMFLVSPKCIGTRSCLYTSIEMKDSLKADIARITGANVANPADVDSQSCPYISPR